MARIALVGRLFSGKSSLARALAGQGYTYLNYTDMLKERTAIALSAATGRLYSIEQVTDRKNELRPVIITLGTEIGFDRGALVPEALAQLGNAPNAVFDNVRFDSQWEQLRAAGFHLVEVVVPRRVLVARAHDVGMSEDKLDHRLANPTENGVTCAPDLVVAGDLPHSWQITEIERRFPFVR